jgi:hypothetical protein
MRADAGADHVVRRLDVRDPVADRLARRLLQRACPELDRADLRAEEAHPLDVGGLSRHVLGAHVDDAVEAEARADGGGGDPVLARAGLRDDPLLAEPAGDERLAKGVVDLVRAGVAEVLALQIDGLPLREPLRSVERGGAADVVALQPAQLGEKAGVVLDLRPAALQLVQGGDERLGHVAPAVGAEVAGVHRRHRAASTNARTRS